MRRPTKEELLKTRMLNEIVEGEVQRRTKAMQEAMDMSIEAAYVSSTLVALTIFHDIYGLEQDFVDEFIDLTAELLQKVGRDKLTTKKLRDHVKEVYGIDMVASMKTKLCPGMPEAMDEDFDFEAWAERKKDEYESR